MPRDLRVTTSFLLVSTLLGCRDHSPTVETRAETLDVAPSAAPIASASAIPSNSTAPQPSASAAPKVLASMPILDEKNGQEAAAVYRAIIEKACAQGTGRIQALRALGLSLESPDFVCVDFAHAAKPIASGSFVNANTDEVLIQGRSGRSWAGGDSVLALMRKDGDQYQLVEHLFNGQGFGAIARISTPNGRDALMMCENGGHMGMYPSVCGFFGELSFEHGSTAIGASLSDTNEIHTIAITMCGEQQASSLGKIEFRNDRLLAPLFVDDLLNEPQSQDETMYCSRVKKKKRQLFTIEYHFDGMRFRRMTPIPKEAKEVWERY